MDHRRVNEYFVELRKKVVKKKVGGAVILESRFDRSKPVLSGSVMLSIYWILHVACIVYSTNKKRHLRIFHI